MVIFCPKAEISSTSFISLVRALGLGPKKIKYLKNQLINGDICHGVSEINSLRVAIKIKTSGKNGLTNLGAQPICFNISQHTDLLRRSRLGP